MSNQTQTISDFLNQSNNFINQIEKTKCLKDIMLIDEKVTKNTSLESLDLIKIRQVIRKKIELIALSMKEIKDIIRYTNSFNLNVYWNHNEPDDFNKSVFNHFKELCNKKTKQSLLKTKKEVSSWNACDNRFMYILDAIIADKIAANKDKETLDSLMEHRLVMQNLRDSYAIKTIDLCIEEKVGTSEDIAKLTKFSKELYNIQANLSGDLERGYYINDKIVCIMKNRINVLSSKIIESMNYSSIEEVLENAPSLEEDKLVSIESIDNEIKRILAKNLENESLQVVIKTFQSMSKEPYAIRKYTGESINYLKELTVLREFIETEANDLQQMIIIFKFLKKNKINNKYFELKFKKEYHKEENINIHRYTTIYFVRKKYLCEDKELTNKYIEIIKEEDSIRVLNKIIEISGMFQYRDFGIQKICETRVLELISEKSKEELQEIFAKCIEKKYFYGNQNFFTEKAKSFIL